VNPAGPIPEVRVSSEARLSTPTEPAGGESPLFPRPRSIAGWVLLPVTWTLIALIRFYQMFISPGLPPSCRFTPSCSQFTLDAVRRHGALKGAWLGARRLGRCHPWHPGGYDPVP
jgi:hypothetical protein